MKKILSFVMAFMVCFTVMAAPVSAMDKRVTASKHWKVTKVITAADASAHKAWKKGYYKGAAKGYITAKQRHTATARLFVMGQHVKYSKKVAGKGKVSANTGWGYSVCAIVPDPYGSAIYYSF